MKFLKTTIIGGVFFLVPITLLGIIAAKLIGIMLVVAEPVAGFIPIESIAGVALVNVIAIAIVVVICFLAGLLAKTEAARAFAEAAETAILQKIPGYTMLKGMTTHLNPEANDRLTAVLVKYGEAQRIAIEVERVGTDRVVIYFPSSPNAFSGFVQIVPAANVEKLDIPLTSVLDHAEQLGRGSHELLTPGARQDHND